MPVYSRVASNKCLQSLWHWRRPDVLILDEPSQGLAPAVFDILEQAFSTLKSRGLALLLAEQNVPFASRIAERYLILSQGQTIRTGGKEDLDNPEEIADAFMGEVGVTNNTFSKQKGVSEL